MFNLAIDSKLLSSPIVRVTGTRFDLLQIGVMGLRVEGVALRSDGLSTSRLKSLSPPAGISPLCWKEFGDHKRSAATHITLPSFRATPDGYFATATGQTDQFKIGLQRLSRP